MVLDTAANRRDLMKRTLKRRNVWMPAALSIPTLSACMPF
jgi:hypothetical protein